MNRSDDTAAVSSSSGRRLSPWATPAAVCPYCGRQLDRPGCCDDCYGKRFGAL